MKEVFVIKSFKKGFWFYYSEGGFDWESNIYLARRFTTYKEANDFLADDKERHWGGFFQIEKFFVKK